jgi:hypothetical protein
MFVLRGTLRERQTIQFPFTVRSRKYKRRLQRVQRPELGRKRRNGGETLRRLIAQHCFAWSDNQIGS